MLRRGVVYRAPPIPIFLSGLCQRPTQINHSEFASTYHRGPFALLLLVVLPVLTTMQHRMPAELIVIAAAPVLIHFVWNCLRSALRHYIRNPVQSALRIIDHAEGTLDHLYQSRAKPKANLDALAAAADATVARPSEPRAMMGQDAPPAPHSRVRSEEVAAPWRPSGASGAALPSCYEVP